MTRWAGIRMLAVQQARPRVGIFQSFGEIKIGRFYRLLSPLIVA